MIMKFQSLVFICFTLLAFNCSSSDDSDGGETRPQGEIILNFDTINPEHTIQFTSTTNDFEIPCEFAEINMYNTTSNGDHTFEMLSMNIPSKALIQGSAFDFNDTFTNSSGSEISSALSIRVNGVVYVAYAGQFSNITYTESTSQDGFSMLNCSAVFMMQQISTGRDIEGSMGIQIRLQIVGLGKGNKVLC